MKTKFVFLIAVATLWLSACSSAAPAGKPATATQSSASAATSSASPAAPQASSPTAPSSASKPAGKYDTVFPLPASVENFTGGGGENGINFQTSLGLNDVVKFYRDALTKQGLTEWTEATSITDGTFSIVFRGAPNGKAIVVQGVSLGSKTNVNVRFESI